MFSIKVETSLLIWNVNQLIEFYVDEKIILWKNYGSTDHEAISNLTEGFAPSINSIASVIAEASVFFPMVVTVNEKVWLKNLFQKLFIVSYSVTKTSEITKTSINIY